MHRAYKRHLNKRKGKADVEEEEDEEGAGYCPLDLYSQDAGRVARAVRQLWTTWNASAGEANNLRFFLDGKVVKPGEVGQLARGVSPRCGYLRFPDYGPA